MIQSKVIWRNVFVLAVTGALAFWVTNFAISRTPIAAEYRAALSISYLPMLLEALLGGLMIGSCVSFFLHRFFNKIPTQDPILKSLLLSFIVLIIVTVLLQAPASFSTTTNDILRYFLVGTLINVIRILALGISIGLLYDKVNGGVR
jgi:heme A synthase